MNRILKIAIGAHAMRIMAHAKGFKKLCFVGRGNTRPVPSRYILEYWMA